MIAVTFNYFKRDWDFRKCGNGSFGFVGSTVFVNRWLPISFSVVPKSSKYRHQLNEIQDIFHRTIYFVDFHDFVIRLSCHSLILGLKIIVNSASRNERSDFNFSFHSRVSFFFDNSINNSEIVSSQLATVKNIPRRIIGASLRALLHCKGKVQ